VTPSNFQTLTPFFVPFGAGAVVAGVVVVGPAPVGDAVVGGAVVEVGVALAGTVLGVGEAVGEAVGDETGVPRVNQLMLTKSDFVVLFMTATRVCGPAGGWLTPVVTVRQLCQPPVLTTGTLASSRPVGLPRCISIVPPALLSEAMRADNVPPSCTLS
jgi:hypothetical protein